MSSLFCGVCGKTGDVQVCTGCEEVYYCGRECQLKDWPTHKVRCKQIQARRRAQAELLQKRKAEEAIPAPQPRPQQLHPTSTAPTITTTTTIIAPAVTATPKISVNAPPAQQQQQQQPASSSSSSPPPPPSAFQPSPPQHGLKGKESGPVTLASSTSGGGGSSGGVVNSAPSPAPQGEEHKSRMDKFTSFTKKIGGSAKKGFESFKDSVGEKTRKLKGNSHEDSNASTANTVSTAGSSGPTSVAAANATMDQLLAPPSPGDPHAVFGVPFETAIERASTTVAGIPDIMIYSFSFLEKNGLDEEGLFRLSGSLREIAKLRGTFQKGEIPPINAVGDPHVISGLLKLYFRELPEPLFEKKNPNPPASDPARGVYRPLFDSVCNEFKKPIQLLFWFLHKVYLQSNVNKMTESNLAIVFSPTLKLSNDAVAKFIADYDTIFDNADLPQLPPTWPDIELGKMYTPSASASTSTSASAPTATPPNPTPSPAEETKDPDTANASAAATVVTTSAGQLSSSESASVLLPSSSSQSQNNSDDNSNSSSNNNNTAISPAETEQKQTSGSALLIDFGDSSPEQPSPAASGSPVPAQPAQTYSSQPPRCPPPPTPPYPPGGPRHHHHRLPMSKPLPLPPQKQLPPPPPPRN